MWKGSVILYSDFGRNHSALIVLKGGFLNLNFCLRAWNLRQMNGFYLFFFVSWPPATLALFLFPKDTNLFSAAGPSPKLFLLVDVSPLESLLG